ncbi:MAG: SEC-C domain-containing protein [Lachnospiraceae bacterium]|nr:SEC-C domain-containing protein [Lachnospiraceae bacterium]
MGIVKDWRDSAYSVDFNSRQGQAIWVKYFAQEKEIYKDILGKPEEIIQGTVGDIAKKYDMDILYMAGFMDGINDSLKEACDLDALDENTEVKLDVDMEKLYYNMVGAKADWLYELPEWDNILPEEKRKELYKEQKKSGVIVKPKKVGRNDPCPCGSGKKYKHCCGRK